MVDRSVDERLPLIPLKRTSSKQRSMMLDNNDSGGSGSSGDKTDLVGAEDEAGLADSSQQWDVVIAYDNTPATASTSRTSGFFQQDKAVLEKRDTIVGELRRVGLYVSQRESSDSKVIFLLVGASHRRLEEQAEFSGLECVLKEEFGGGYCAYSRSKRNLFVEVAPGQLFTKTTRQRLTVEIIESEKDDGGCDFNLRHLEATGVIEKAYPLHDTATKTWFIEEWIKKPRAPIPMEKIRDYFGEEIAFYFAWLHFYTRWLIYAAGVGFLASIFGWAKIAGENYWSSTVYSVFLGLWATLFLEFWKRERNVWAWKWNMLDFEDVEGLRAGFEGQPTLGAYSKGEFIHLREDEVYGTAPPKPIKMFPPTTTQMRMSAAFSLVAVLSIVVVIATISVLTVRVLIQNQGYSTPASVIGGILNAIVIMLLNRFYRTVANKLNDWENHRTHTQYYNNLIFKIFLFQFVNSYTSMYYIAFFKRTAMLWSDTHLQDKCGDADDSNEDIGFGCPNQLFIQLLTILLTNIVVGQSQEVLIPLVTSRLKAYMSERQSKVQEAELPKYERDYQLNQFEGMVDEYGEMVIQYGYLTLFAASLPIAPLLAVVNNLVEMRTDMFKWLTSYNKPFYRGADDIGGWYSILQILGVAAVITNCLLLFFSFPTLRDLISSTYNVLWTCVILEHIIFLIKFVISEVVPDIPSNIRAILAKQYYIQQQLVKKYEQKHIGTESERSLKRELDEIENFGEAAPSDDNVKNPEKFQ